VFGTAHRISRSGHITPEEEAFGNNWTGH